MKSPRLSPQTFIKPRTLILGTLEEPLTSAPRETKNTPQNDVICALD
jgi:hypothetical protein